MEKKVFCLLCCVLMSAAVFMASCSQTEQDPFDTDAFEDTKEQGDAEDNEVPQRDQRDIRIMSIYDIIDGSEHEASDGQEDSGAVIELDYRSVEKMVSKDTGSSKTYYPRVKVLSDNTYMLIYQNGRWGPDVYYKTSTDYVNWSEPKLLFGRQSIDGDMKKFATADAVVMPDGEIIVVCTYLSESNYTTKNTYNGLAMKRSGDNGKTWSDMQIIYGATAWEPDILLRSDGQLQIYFTHTGPYIELYGYADKRSSGSAMLISSDGGRTWSPDTSKSPYEAWRVLQIPVGEYNGRAYFTGQMPVAVELHNGDMMVAVETQYLDSSCYISLGYSKDNWKTPLGLVESGPAELKERLFGGVAPYLVQFDSGEVVLSYVTVTDGIMRLRMCGSDGRSVGDENAVLEGISTGLWSSIEVLDDHTLGIVCDYQPTLSSGETMSFLTVSRGLLDHAFCASKADKITIDGDNSDWNRGVDAIFVGSNSQAQCSVRVAEDDENVYFIVDRLDEYVCDKDTVTLYVSAAEGVYYKIELDARGVVEIQKFADGRFSSVDVSFVDCATYIGATIGNDKDKDDGYIVELSISKKDLSLSGKHMYVNVMLENTDKKEKFDKDMLIPTKMSDISTWIKVTVA